MPNEWGDLETGARTNDWGDLEVTAEVQTAEPTFTEPSVAEPEPHTLEPEAEPYTQARALRRKRLDEASAGYQADANLSRLERIARRTGLGIKAGVGDVLQQAGGFMTSPLVKVSNLAPMAPLVKRAGEELVRTGKGITEAAQERSEALGGGAAAAVPEFLARMGVSTVPSVIAAIGGGMPAAIGTGAMQSFGSTFLDARDKYLAKGDSPTAAEAKATFVGGISGLITGALVKAFGATGIEALSKGLNLGKVKHALREAFKQAGFEAAEEGLDQAGQEILAQISYDPERTLAQSVTNVAVALGGGGFFGFTVTGAGLPVARAARGSRKKALEELKRAPVWKEYLDQIKDTKEREAITESLTDEIMAVGRQAPEPPELTQPTPGESYAIGQRPQQPGDLGEYPGVNAQLQEQGQDRQRAAAEQTARIAGGPGSELPAGGAAPVSVAPGQAEVIPTIEPTIEPKGGGIREDEGQRQKEGVQVTPPAISPPPGETGLGAGAATTAEPAAIASPTAPAGNAFEVTTPPMVGKKPITAKGQWDIVDASEFGYMGGITTLQERNRRSQQSQEQIAAIATGLDPRYLGDSASADSGAPIIDTAGERIAGYGRVEAIKQAYAAQGPQAQAYRQFVRAEAERLGLSEKLKNIPNPILVRRVESFAGGTREQFASDSNVSQALPFTPAELALSDAKVIQESGIMDLFSVTEDGKINRQFLDQFYNGVKARDGLKSSDGTQYLPAMYTRVRVAILTALLSQSKRPEAVIRNVIENAKELGLLNVVNGLTQSAGKLLRLEGTDYSLGDDLTIAFQEYLDAKGQMDKGWITNVSEFMRQKTLFAGDRTVESGLLLEQFFAFKSAKQVAEFFLDYARKAEALTKDTATPDMFGNVDRPTVEALLKGIRNEPKLPGSSAGRQAAPAEQKATGAGVEPAGEATKPKPGKGQAGAGPAVGGETAAALREPSTGANLPARYETGNLPGRQQTGGVLERLIGRARTSLATAPERHLQQARALAEQQGIFVAQLPRRPDGALNWRTLSDQQINRIFDLERQRLDAIGEYFKEINRSGITYPSRAAFLAESARTDRQRIKDMLRVIRTGKSHPELIAARAELERRYAEFKQQVDELVSEAETAAASIPIGWQETGKVEAPIKSGYEDVLSGEMDATKIWQAIEQRTSNPFYRMMAKLYQARKVLPKFERMTVAQARAQFPDLFKTVPEGSEPGAFYTRSINTITLLDNFLPTASFMEYVLIHEGSHAATLHGLLTDKQFAKEVADLAAEASKLPGFKKFYGATNLAEFLSEAHSAAEFQSFLEQASVTVPKQGKSIWRRLVEAIAKFFGFHVEQTEQVDLLEALMRVVVPRMQGMTEADVQAVQAAKKGVAAAELTPDQLRARGYIKVYRGINRGTAFNESGTTWWSTNKDVADTYAREVFAYEDPVVLEAWVRIKDLPKHDIRKLTEAELAALNPDQFGNPQDIGVYYNSDDSLLNVRHTVIHAPASEVFVPAASAEAAGLSGGVGETAPTLAPTAEVAQRAMVRAETADRVEAEANLLNVQASGILNFLDQYLQPLQVQAQGADLLGRVLSRLGYMDLAGVQAASQQARMTYGQFKTAFPEADYWRVAALEASHKLFLEQRKWGEIRGELTALQAKIGSEAYQNRVTRTIELGLQKEALDEAWANYQATIKDQLVTAQKALQTESRNQGQAELLLAQVRSLESRDQFEAAIRQGMTDMINVLATNPTAAAMIYAGDKPPEIRAVLEQYLRIKQQLVDAGTSQPAQDQVVLEMAAEALVNAREASERLILGALVRSNLEFRGQMEALDRAFYQRFQAKPRGLFNEILREARSQAKASERTLTAWKKLRKELTRDMTELETLSATVEVLDGIENDLAYTAYQNEIYGDAKIERRPDLTVEVNGKKVKLSDLNYDAVSGNPIFPLPDGSVIQVQLLGDAQAFEAERQRMEEALNVLRDWKADQDALPAEQRSSAYAFFVGHMRALENIYLSTRVTHPSSLAGMRNVAGETLGAWDMPVFILEDVGSRVGGAAKTAAAVFRKVHKLARNLMVQQHRLTVAQYAAANSYNFPGNQNARVIEMYDRVLQPLFAMAQQPGFKLRAGIVVGEGFTVTQQVVDLLRLQRDLAGEGFRIVQEKVPGALPGTAFPEIVEDQVYGIQWHGQAIKVNDSTLPYSGAPQEALAFIAQYRRLTEAGQVEQAQALLANNWPLLFSYLADRASAVLVPSPYENAYRLLVERLRANPPRLFERNLNWLAEQVAGINGEEPEAVLGQMTKELSDVVRIFGQQQAEVDAATNVSSPEQKTSFTARRHDRGLPYYFSRFGWRTGADFINFVSNIHAGSYARYARGLESVLLDLKRMRDELTLKYQQKVAAGVPAAKAEKQTVKEQQRAYLNGQTYDHYQSLDKKIRILERLIKEQNELYGGGGKEAEMDVRTLRRVMMAGVSGLLSAFTVAIRNGAGLSYLGSQMARLRQNAATASVDTALRLIWEGFGRTGLLTHALAPLAKLGVFQNVYERVNRYKRLEEAGLVQPMDFVNEFKAKIRNLSNGGMVLDVQRGPVDKALLAMVDVFDAGILLPLKTLFPRAGDKVIDVTAESAVNGLAVEMENRVKDMFDTWQKASQLETRFNFDNPLDPKNAITHQEFFPGFLDASARQKLEYARQTFEWSGVTLDRVIFDLLAKLRAGETNAKLFEDWQKTALTETILDTVNVPDVLNRPLWTHKRDVLSQLFSPLVGWNAHALRQFAKLMSRAGVAPGESAARLWAGTLLVVLPSILALNLAQDMGVEEIIRLFYRMFGVERATRQPWEQQGTGRMVVGLTISAFNPIPYLSMAINTALNDSPARASFDPTPVAINKLKDLAVYFGGVARTGDPLYGLDRLAGSYLPVVGPILNQLPAKSGYQEALNARRLMTRYGDPDLLRPKTGPEIGTATRLTPYGPRLVNAAMQGDDAQFLSLYREAVGVAKDMGKANPEKVVQQMFTSRNPYDRAFKAKLSSEQRGEFLGRLNLRERELVTDMEGKFAHASGLLGATATFERQAPGMGAVSGGGRMAVASPIRRAFRTRRLGRTRLGRGRVRRTALRRGRTISSRFSLRRGVRRIARR